MSLSVFRFFIVLPAAVAVAISLDAAAGTNSVPVVGVIWETSWVGACVVRADTPVMRTSSGVLVYAPDHLPAYQTECPAGTPIPPSVAAFAVKLYAPHR